MNLLRGIVMLLGGVLVHAGAADATPRETAGFTGVPSNGTLGAPANSVRTATLSGGYTLGRVDYSGSITSSTATTWLTDARVLVTSPTGQVVTVQPFLSGTTFTTSNFSGSIFLPAGTSPAGTWSFRFYETVDDGGPGAVDASVSVTFTFTDEPPVAPAATDLGTLAAPGVTVSNMAVGAGQVRWYRFAIPRPAMAARGTYLDLDSAGSSILPTTNPPTLLNDTQMALYDSSGRLIASDNDSGPGFMSLLTFGIGGRPPVDGSVPFDGRNGPLPQGVYYLAAGPYNLTFGPANWAVSGSGVQSGTLTLHLRTNVSTVFPCPGDWNGDSAFTPADVAGFVNAWAADLGAGTTYTDVTGDGAVTPADVSTFVNAWFQSVSNGSC